MVWVPRTRWLIGDVRRDTARELRAAYDHGASIREIATEAGLSYTATHRLLGTVEVSHALWCLSRLHVDAVLLNSVCTGHVSRRDC
ncbi:helix-turn-helix domain-containing protein [Embleya sp. NPDC020630]|uniref:helix-turn-helix domain-containing protein n=1 Tax=Embleya sp. NPDC020630 TaxID=3363979 RepID=UPI0037BCE308